MPDSAAIGPAIERALSQLATFSALIIEMVAVLLIAYGAAQAAIRTVSQSFRREPGWRKSVWVDFGVWLLLGLQFALAADIVRSVISPTWEDIGRLAAIAVIRTFLNYFLEKDLDEAERYPNFQPHQHNGHTRPSPP